jgi:hypothetical protein
MTSLVVDCDRCQARGPACGDCVISALLGVPPAARPILDAEERRVLGLFADSGLLPPLRLVAPVVARPSAGDPQRRLWA